MAFCSVSQTHMAPLPQAPAAHCRLPQLYWSGNGKLGTAFARTAVRLPLVRRGHLRAAAIEDVAQDAAAVDERSDVTAAHSDRPTGDNSEPEEASSSSQGPDQRRSTNSDGWSSGLYRTTRGRGRGRGGGSSGQRGGGPQTSGQRPSSAPAPQEPDPRRAPCTEHNFKRFDTVMGRVVKQLFKGSLVELLDDPRIIGFVRHMDGPFLMRGRVTGQHGDTPMPIGLVRPFKVLAIPEDMEFYGRGPLLAAKELDLDVLWSRARQMQAACEQDAEAFRVTVTDANTGGLLATVGSLPAFLPFSLMLKDAGSDWLSPDSLREEWVGKDVLVTVREVAPEKRKVVIDMQQAAANQLMRSFAVGSLVWGTVRRVESYGAFVGIDGTRLSGLLHISCISRSHIDNVEDVFQEGERVRCMLLGMDEGFSRISLSTADLERQPGDMLFDKEKVYAEADEVVQDALQRLQLLHADDRRPDAGGRDYNRGSDDFDFDGGFEGR